MKRQRDREKGAAAVEFALVLIPLIILLLGIIEFGYVFNQQLTVTNAAREGARVLAITRDETMAKKAVVKAAELLQSSPTVKIVETCPATGGGDAKVGVTLALTTITGLEKWVPGLGPIKLTGKGVTPCGG